MKASTSVIPLMTDITALSRWMRRYPTTAVTTLITAVITMPELTLSPLSRVATACPPSTALEAKEPVYMTITTTTTSRLPQEPNCALVCSIWGTPMRGPCAAAGP